MTLAVLLLLTIKASTPPATSVAKPNMPLAGSTANTTVKLFASSSMLISLSVKSPLGLSFVLIVNHCDAAKLITGGLFSSTILTVRCISSLKIMLSALPCPWSLKVIANVCSTLVRSAPVGAHVEWSNPKDCNTALTADRLAPSENVNCKSCPLVPSAVVSMFATAVLR